MATSHSVKAKLARLLEMPEEKVAESLAITAKTARQLSFLRPHRQKSAGIEEIKSWLQNAGGGAADWVKEKSAPVVDWAKKNPGQASAAGGAAIGAGLGGLSSFGREKSRRNTLGSMLGGGIAGGMVGGGGYLAYNNLKGKGKPKGGKPDLSDPKNVAENSPEILEEVENAMPDSLLYRVMQNTGQAYNDISEKHPILSNLAKLDLGLLGLGTAAGVMPKTTDINVNSFKQGINNIFKNPAKYGYSAEDATNLAAQARRMSFEEIGELLTRIRGGWSNTGSALGGLTENEVRNISQAGSKGLKHFTPGTMGDWVNSLRRALGYDSDSAVALMGSGYKPGTAAGAVTKVDGPLARMMRTLNHGFDTQLPLTAGKRMAPRALLYGGIPLAMGAYNTWQQDNQSQQRVQELLDKLNLE